jgi:hypothetical protein
MQIKLKQVKIRELVAKFKDEGDEGVTGYNGRLDIRPAFQREFVYPEKMQVAVIESVLAGFPLNVFYWSQTVEGHYELLDGQQRTLSICKFIDGKFSIATPVGKCFFNGLPAEEQKKILDYEILVYICEGTETERLSWFNIVNTGGVILNAQELRNACYTGTWLTCAKRRFSKADGVGIKGMQHKGKPLMKGAPNRQEVLETVLHWYGDSKGKEGKKEDVVSSIMGDCKAFEDSEGLWEYFKDVMNWVKATFPKYRKEMNGLQWGLLYNQYKHCELDPIEIEGSISALMADEEVTKKSGVYEFVLSGDTKHLSLRAFSDNQKREVFEKQKGVCPICEGTFALEAMQGDHIVPWSKGGKSTTDNLQMLCRKCNLGKSNKF